jgi:hypothetical protein
MRTLWRARKTKIDACAIKVVWCLHAMIFASVGAIAVVSIGMIRVCGLDPGHQKMMGTAGS